MRTFTYKWNSEFPDDIVVTDDFSGESRITTLRQLGYKAPKGLSALIDYGKRSFTLTLEADLSGYPSVYYWLPEYPESVIVCHPDDDYTRHTVPISEIPNDFLLRSHIKDAISRQKATKIVISRDMNSLQFSEI